jgi:hypothetical protein
MKFFIPKTGIKAIDTAIEALFYRMKARFLGKRYEPKKIRFNVTGFDKPINYRPDLSMPDLFEEAAKAEGFKPNKKLQEVVVNSIEHYLDAHQELTKAKVKNAVQAALSDAEVSKDDVNIGKILKEELKTVMKKVSADVGVVVDSELGRAKNLSTLDSISKANTMVGIDDPTIVFIGPNDLYTCKDCKRLYFMEDGMTPRVWKMSELKGGFGKHGGLCPCTGGQHPHCKHFMSNMMPGFGFGSDGRIKYIDPEYDVYNDQHRL